MLIVSVRALKEQTSEILRRVREERISIDITHRDEVIARLVPVPPPSQEAAEVETFLVDLDALSATIGAAWTGGSATEVIDEGRRDL